MIKYRTRFAQLIAEIEGFNRPGTIPNRRHNPGDLRHSVHGSHEGIGPDDVAIEPDDQTGVDDLEHQLQLYARRGMTIGQAVNVYAPPTENNTSRYLDFICRGLGLPPGAPMTLALPVQPT
jgi:hypothetical protein